MACTPETHVPIDSSDKITFMMKEGDTSNENNNISVEIKKKVVRFESVLDKYREEISERNMSEFNMQYYKDSYDSNMAKFNYYKLRYGIGYSINQEYGDKMFYINLNRAVTYYNLAQQDQIQIVILSKKV
jgi:hypothetical protein